MLSVHWKVHRSCYELHNEPVFLPQRASAMQSILMLALEPEYMEFPQNSSLELRGCLLEYTMCFPSDSQNPNFRTEFWQISDVKLS